MILYMRPRWRRQIWAWRAKRIKQKKQQMAEAEASKNGGPRETEKHGHLEDAEEAKG